MEYKLTSIQHPMFKLQPEQVRVRPSITRALYHKVIRWVEKSKASTIMRTIGRILMAVIIGIGVFYPSSTVDAIVDVLQWNGYRIPLYVAILAAVFHWRRVARLSTRMSLKRAGSNQHMYEGIPVDNLATFLFESGAFKREEAMARLGLSRDKYDAMSQKLENAAVLVRGECNARVINPNMSREVLVKQLREDFPLRYDEHTKDWYEYNGSYMRHLADRERAERKETERAERLERRVERAKNQLAEIASAADMGFTQRALTLV